MATDKELILLTLNEIKNKSGYNDIKPLWNKSNIEDLDQNRILHSLFRFGYAQHGHGQRFHLMITDPVGINALNNPHKLNDDGSFNKSIGEKLKLFGRKYWILVAIIGGIWGIIKVDAVKYIREYLQDEKQDTMKVNKELPIIKKAKIDTIAIKPDTLKKGN